MNKEFDEYPDEMHPYLLKLEAMDPISLADLKSAKLPTAGIYVLYEGEKP